MGMKLLAAALAGALVGGVGVYQWRSEELRSRQASLIRAVIDQTRAEHERDGLAADLEKAELRLTRLQTKECSGLGDLDRKTAQITFIQNGQIQAASPDGDVTDCLIELEGKPEGLAWGPLGDRVLAGDTTYFPGRTHDVAHSGFWSRPEGTSLIYIDDRSGRLLKTSSTGGPVEDISFLKKHVSVAYHPAGTHIAVAGRLRNGVEGIFFATNMGTDHYLAVRGESSPWINSLVFSQDGRHLYFTARHDGMFHLHDLAVSSGKDIGSELDVAPGQLSTLYETDRILSPPTVSPFSKKPQVAVVEGDCSEPNETLILERGKMVPLEWPVEDESPFAVGWLPDDRLVVNVGLQGHCATGRSIEVWDPSAATRTTIVASRAMSPVAAVRARLPKAPDPPVPAQEVPA